MHCDVLKIQDGEAIVDKLNSISVSKLVSLSIYVLRYFTDSKLLSPVCYRPNKCSIKFD